MESLRHDVEPYSIHTTVVEPGFFRTELLVDGSTIWPELSIDDYAPRTAPTIEGMKGMNGQQPGDPAKLARALLTIADQDKPPAALRRRRATPSRPPRPRPANSSPRPTPPANWAATWPTPTPDRHLRLESSRAPRRRPLRQGVSDEARITGRA